MVSTFIIYDLILLVAFTLGVIYFLYTHKHNVQRQGLLYLYRTRLGIKFIDKFTKRYGTFLKKIELLVITSGYILMIAVTWLLAKLSWVYLSSPTLAKAVKIPLVLPLFPYIPELFKIDFLPSFPFTYWIIIIAVIAVPHEFAHGIYARLHKLKIHATGFGFLGPILAAFVEPDEKQLNKAPKRAQLSVLAAGTFANVLFTILFAAIMWLFFAAFFVPAGVNFNTYGSTVIDIDKTQIPENFLDSNETFIELSSQNKSYFSTKAGLQQALDLEIEQIQVFEDTPAFRNRLDGSIVEIDGVPITSLQSLTQEIQKHSPGETVEIKLATPENVRDFNPEIKSYEITFAERDGQAYLGVGIAPPQLRGFMGAFYSSIASIKDPFIYYKSTIGDFGWFIYNLLWWMTLILISVALFNMLPVGIFDGGRFFMLTVWHLTGSKKVAERAYKWVTWLFLVLIIALVLKWVAIFF